MPNGGFELVITARREDRLAKWLRALERTHSRRVHVIASDLSGRTHRHRSARRSRRAGVTIDALVNNAGYGVPGTYVGVIMGAARRDASCHGHCRRGADVSPAARHDRAPIRPDHHRRVAGRSRAGVGGTYALRGDSKAFAIKFSEALCTRRQAAWRARDGGRAWFHAPANSTTSTGTRDAVSKLPAWMWMDAPTVARQGFDAVMEGTPIYINGRRRSARSWHSSVIRRQPIVYVGWTTSGKVVSEECTYAVRNWRASRSTREESVSPSSANAEASGDHASL